MPRAPEPAKPSSTRMPSREVWAWSTLNSPSRTRSAVGRVCLPGGAVMRLPPNVPPTILNMADTLHNCLHNGTHPMDSLPAVAAVWAGA